MARTLRKPYFDFGFGQHDSPRGGFRRQPRGTVAHLENCYIDRQGNVRPRPGSKARNAAESNGGSAAGLTGTECWGMTNFRTVTGTEIHIKIMGRTAYRSTDYGATWSAITGATTLTEFPWSFETMEVAGVNYLIGANGTNFIEYDGTTWAEIEDAPYQPHYLAVHQSRLYMARGDSATLWGSRIADFREWATPYALSLPINTNDGDTLTGIVSGGTVLLIFKAYSASWLSGVGNSDVVVAAGAAGLSDSNGCVGHRTIVRAGNNIMWLSARGVESWSERGGVKLVSSPISFTVDESNYLLRVRPLYGMLPWACYDDRLESYRLFISSMTSGTAVSAAGVQDRAYRLLPMHGGWSVDSYNAPTTLTGKGWMAGMIAGTAEGDFALYGAVRGLGYVFREDESAPGDYVLSNGATTYRAAIDQKIRLPITDMHVANRNKKLHTIRIVGGYGGATPATFDLIVKGDVTRDGASSTVTRSGETWSAKSGSTLMPVRIKTACRGETFEITLQKTINGAPGTAGAGIHLRSLEAEGKLLEGAI